MNTKIILGIDPGLADTGWGVLEASTQGFKFIDSGSLKTNPKDENSYRLKLIGDEIKSVIQKYNPQESCLEEVFVNKNNLSSLKLGQARGAIIYVLADNNIPIFEYSATNIKKSIVGVGRAEKHQISAMLKILLPKATPKNDHEADALACAVCHANQTSSNYDWQTKRRN
ncbi:MAG: crossover junction endodeoxyribonuclease RuvC [Rickettsiales bacterium]|nr:crossover junction endodeoxyribonuclease RuvC [Rickettsiales bacterium]